MKQEFGVKEMWKIIAVGTFFLLLTGCGERRPPMTEVRGSVTFRGEPLHFGTVLLKPDDPERKHIPTAKIQEDGSFSFSVSRAQTEWEGAPLGEYSVSVLCYTSDAPDYVSKTGEDGELGKSLIPEKYQNPAASGLRVKVERGMEPLKIVLD